MKSDARLIKDAAKELQIGSKTLYELLHQKGYIARGTNFPRDEMVRAGYFRSEQRTREIKRPGDSQGKSLPYYVTIVTDEGLEFLRGIVAEYKAAHTPAPGRIRFTVEIIDSSIAHAMARFSQLLAKPEEALTTQDKDEWRVIREYLAARLPVIATSNFERCSRKLLSHPKFQTVFHQPETT